MNEEDSINEWQLTERLERFKENARLPERL
jgi:hypothetical protein